MGDLITEAVVGTLYYLDKEMFDNIITSEANDFSQVEIYANMARLNALYMIANAGSGHIGSSFSSMDIVTYLYLKDMKDQDVYFSSKGHDAPGLYAVLTALGVLPFDNIHLLRRLKGLPGHPDVNVPGMISNTGSLGMGISKAKGMAFANKHKGYQSHINVMTGDGELQEGQIWESLISAANHSVSDITVIVDHNKIQSDYSVERTSSLGDLEGKFRAFGWHVQTIDGHDVKHISSALNNAKKETEKPSVIIADTIKGKGVSFMEGVSVDSDVERFQFHSGAPNAQDYTRAAQELISKINQSCKQVGIKHPVYETVVRKAKSSSGTALKLFPAYTKALLEQSEKNNNIVALDADLVLDMGLEPFRDIYPDRFLECGIAEMDMVSQAGGMALNGLLPIVHSFSCFLSTRPNEQIYNNATEHTKIVYVGGLSGVLPAGPGHSHQSVREISALGSIPNMVMVEPAHPSEVSSLLDWCVNIHDGPSFLRLISIPYKTNYNPKSEFEVIKGQGRVAKEGNDITLISAGLLGVSLAHSVADELTEKGFEVQIIALPFLNVVDGQWLKDVLGPSRLVVTIDNHYRRYGQGDAIAVALSEVDGLKDRGLLRIGLETTPPSGTNDEVLEHVGLDPVSITQQILEVVGNSE